MLRRKFVQLIGLAATAALFPVVAIGKVLGTAKPLTIANIIDVSWSEAAPEACRYGEFSDDRLNAMLLAGQIEVRHSIKPTHSISIPTMWIEKDEDRNPTENDKITLSSSLIKNTVSSVDDVLQGHLINGRRIAVLPRHSRYAKGATIHYNKKESFTNTVYFFNTTVQYEVLS